jgi:hypothetical protein
MWHFLLAASELIHICMLNINNVIITLKLLGTTMQNVVAQDFCTPASRGLKKPVVGNFMPC